MNATSTVFALPPPLAVPAAIPLSTSVPPRARRSRLRWWHLPVGFVLAGLFLILALVLSFRMGGGARALQRSALAAEPQRWDRQVEFGVGRLPLSVSRFLLQWAPLEPEARAALNAVRFADVGLYRQRSEFGGAHVADAGTLAKVHQDMSRRGWDPVVSVVDGEQRVLVFVPRSADSPRKLEAAVMVVNEEAMILASGAVDLEQLLPLMEGREPWSLEELREGGFGR